MRQKLIKLLPIVAVITVLWVGYYYTKSKEFFDNPSVDKTFFNNINNMFNPVMPHSITTKDMNKATQGRRATNQPYISDAYEKKTGQANTKVGTIYDPQALEKAKICEAVKGENCNAFDNEDFAKYCGISFDETGKNSKGEKHTGGLYIDPSYKESVPSNGKFYPTFGTSEYFAINKRTCKFMKDDIPCRVKKVSQIGTNNCTLCYTTRDRQTIEPGNAILKPGFTFYTNATDLELKANSTAYTLISSNTNIPVSANVAAGPAINASTGESMKTVSITNVNINEGHSLIITAKHTNTDTTVLLAGFMMGLTQGGSVQMDINEIIDTDNGGTPLIAGNVSGYLIIQQNYNKDNVNIKLNGIMPFSFIDTMSADSDNCTDGPFITTLKGANYIAQNEPCYGPDAKPGAYSKECLQSIFLSAGGTREGKGFPNTDATAAVLNSEGTLNDIGYYLYRKSVLASTGIQGGNQALMADWDAASQYMTGKSISNPCETSDKKMGITADCFNYLYNKSGCMERGTYNPNIEKNPTYVIPDPIKTTKNIGDVSEFYTLTRQKANNPALSNKTRENAFLGCYGVILQQK